MELRGGWLWCWELSGQLRITIRQQCLTCTFLHASSLWLGRVGKRWWGASVSSQLASKHQGFFLPPRRKGFGLYRSL